MTKRAAHCMAGLALAAMATAASGKVDVRFDDPKRFVDATLEGYGEEPEANPVLAEIRRHLLTLGERCIPAEQSFEILVRELDLAGDYDWRHRPAAGNVRLLPNVAWTRMTIEYVWRAADGTLIATSVDRLQDADFLGNSFGLRRRDVALPDEKEMLDRWFEARFCRDRAGASAPAAGR
jgi:hypothetical protein